MYLQKKIYQQIPIFVNTKPQVFLQGKNFTSVTLNMTTTAKIIMLWRQNSMTKSSILMTQEEPINMVHISTIQQHPIVNDTHQFCSEASLVLVSSLAETLKQEKNYHGTTITGIKRGHGFMVYY